MQPGAAPVRKRAGAVLHSGRVCFAAWTTVESEPPRPTLLGAEADRCTHARTSRECDEPARWSACLAARRARYGRRGARVERTCPDGASAPRGDRAVPRLPR